MEELAVKIQICGRVYPMKVQATEEKCIRTASKLINERVKIYSDRFGIHDKQDLLAMVSLDCFVDTLKLKETTTQEAKNIEEQVDSLVNAVNQALT